MANTFTPSKAWPSAGSVGKSFLTVQGTLVIDTTASGGAADGDLPASLFGLNEIVECGIIINDDNSKLFFASPSYDGDSLIVGIGSSNAPIDLPNDTYKITVTGY